MTAAWAARIAMRVTQRVIYTQLPTKLASGGAFSSEENEFGHGPTVFTHQVTVN